MSSANGTPRPTATFQRTLTVGLLLHVSICDNAARLTPDERARSSSDIPRAFRLCRRFSATRRPRSAAPTSSPGLALGRLGLRVTVRASTIANTWLALRDFLHRGPRRRTAPARRAASYHARE